MNDTQEIKRVRRLNTELPDSLALFVGEVTGDGAPHESPDEFICALLHREMERSQSQEYDEVRAMLLESMNENDYDDWTPSDMAEVRKAATG